MDFEKFEIITENRNFSVADFLDENKQHKYVIHPPFQRNYVWDKHKASCLIESILLGLPIPVIYLYQHHIDGKFHVIDGQQRLTAIRQFLNNVYDLTGLKTLTDLNGLRFAELKPETQNKINDYILDSKCFKNITDKKIVYEIFERFNTGVMTLKPQEIRNCVFMGQFNDFIKELTKYEGFNNTIPDSKALRMAKEEFIVRFLAMYENNHYSLNSLQGFLTSYYESKQHLDALSKKEFKDQTRELERTFKKAVDACRIVFKNNAFKGYKRTKHTNQYGFNTFTPKVYDLQMLCFAELDLAEVSRNADKIFTEYTNFAKRSPFLNPEIGGKQDLKAALRKLQDRIGKIIYDNYIS